MTAFVLAALLGVQEVDARRYDVPLDALYDAAYRAALGLDLRVETTTKDNLQGLYRGTTPEGRPFAIRLLRLDENTTRAEVSVQNEPDASARLHAAMQALTAD